MACMYIHGHRPPPVPARTRVTYHDDNKLEGQGAGGRGAPATGRSRCAGCRASLRPTPRTRPELSVGQSGQWELSWTRSGRAVGSGYDSRHSRTLGANFPTCPRHRSPRTELDDCYRLNGTRLLASASPTPPLHAHPRSSQRVEHVLELDKFVGFRRRVALNEHVHLDA